MYYIQHSDRNLPANYYEDEVKSKYIHVRKIFPTIQGEGPFAGTPAIFIRLAGCNRGAKVGMNCEFCDTDFHVDKGLSIHPEEVVRQVAAMTKGYSIKLVVITGGEPMLQPALPKLLELLRQDQRKVQIESNGDFLVDGYEAILFWDADFLILVVSPKMSGTPPRYLPLKHKVFQYFNYLKILVDAREDNPYHNLPDYVINDTLIKENIYLSPIAVYKRPVETGEIASAWDQSLIDVKLTSANYRYAVRLAIQHGFRVSTQQHLFMGAE